MPVDALGGGRARFALWAPRAKRVDLVISHPVESRMPMRPLGDGHFEIVAEAGPGTRYAYALDGEPPLPDPDSLFQPDGVHAASEVVDIGRLSEIAGTSAGIDLERAVLYEMHVGTFTPEGNFDAAAEHFERLARLGVTAVEVLPLAEFPGDRNWGYDGVYPSAVTTAYGGPNGFARFVRRAHEAGLGVVVDVVYNHLGPEGNYFGKYGPYFTDKVRTPWGAAVNVDDADSDHVREHFLRSAERWVRVFGVDGLRVDAIHAIVDTSAVPFLEELTVRVHAAGEAVGARVVLIAESDLGTRRVVDSPSDGGLGFDAMWCDDLHHALHALATGERSGYYADFADRELVPRAVDDGLAYQGQVSEYRKRRHGRPVGELEPWRVVVYAQTHDQVGNRMLGERLVSLAGRERATLAACVTMLSPHTPMLFMGEEHGANEPFLFFADFGDPHLVRGVREGRKAEFASFGWPGEPPAPEAIETFRRSTLAEPSDARDAHPMSDVYRQLIELRRKARPRRSRSRWLESGDVLEMRVEGERDLRVLANFSDRPVAIDTDEHERVWLSVTGERVGGPAEAPVELAAFEAAVLGG